MIGHHGKGTPLNLNSSRMNEFWTAVLTVAQTAATQVGKKLLTEFGQVQATQKADGSLVTPSDQWADQFLRMAITTAFPKHGLLSEEVEHQFPAADWCWVIDPIDGTTNFTRGVPIWAISLGLLYRGVPVFGYVYIPPLQQSFHGFWSAPNQTNGAFLNQRAIGPRPDAPEGSQFFSLCARSTAVLQHPFPCKIRMLGSAAYNLLTVAAGMTLGAVEATPKIWDIAAVWPIVHAAGAAWVPLASEPIFPLQVGADYSDHPYPTLVVSQTRWVETFLPRVQCVLASRENNLA